MPTRRGTNYVYITLIGTFFSYIVTKTCYFYMN
jgi:hypothetical protein